MSSAVFRLIAGWKPAEEAGYADEYVEAGPWIQGHIVALALQLEPTKDLSMTTPATLEVFSHGGDKKFFELKLMPIVLPSGTVHFALMNGQIRNFWGRLVYCTAGGMTRKVLRSFMIKREFIGPAYAEMTKKEIIPYSAQQHGILSTAGPEHKKKTVSEVAWGSSKDKIVAHGITLFEFKDALSEQVLRMFCGGKRVMHMGPMSLFRIEEHYSFQALNAPAFFSAV